MGDSFDFHARKIISGNICMGPSLVKGPGIARPIRLGIGKRNFRHVGASVDNSS